MKKLAIALALMLVLTPCAFAEDLGVQVIGGKGAETVPLSLDDMQIGTSYTIDGYAIVTPKVSSFVDCFAQFGEKENYGVHRYNYEGDVFCHSESNAPYDSWRYSDAAWMDSGESADFFWLMMDIVNLQKSDVDYAEEATVKVVYQDDYEFNGWIRQIVYDHMETQHGDKCVSRNGYEKGAYPNEIVMNPAKVEAIGMMYTGTYAFGCTLPNFVVEDKSSPLRIEIKLGENDLTYNIRK